MTTYVKIQFLANSAVARVFVAAVLFVCLLRAYGTDQGSEQALIYNDPSFLGSELKLTVVQSCRLVFEQAAITSSQQQQISCHKTDCAG